MSVTEIKNARDAEVVNTNFAFIEGLVAKLAAAEFREEGLDRQALADEIVARRSGAFSKVISGGSDTTLTNTVFAVPTISGVQMRLDSGGGGFTIAADEKMVIRAAVFCPTNPTPLYGVPAGRTVEARLSRQLSGGGVVLLTGSQAHTGTQGLPTVPGNSGSLYLVGELGPGTYDFVQMETRIVGGAGTYRLNYASILGRIYKRVS